MDRCRWRPTLLARELAATLWLLWLRPRERCAGELLLALRTATEAGLRPDRWGDGDGAAAAARPAALLNHLTTADPEGNEGPVVYLLRAAAPPEGGRGGQA